MNTFYILPNEYASLYYTSSTDRTASGFDLFIHTDITIMPGQTGVLIPLGIRAVLISEHGETTYPFLLMPRSSIYKTGLTMANSIGLIDLDYRGEIKAPVYNHTNYSIHIKKGTALFQLVAPNYLPTDVCVKPLDWDFKFYQTERGEGGFGSTGSTHMSDEKSVSDNIEADGDMSAAAIVS
jgi:dUTP pyrophosphatase